jgi:hypothetical protein
MFRKPPKRKWKTSAQESRPTTRQQRDKTRSSGHKEDSNMSQFVFSSGSGVRDRMAVQSGNNRGLGSDHSGETWGTLQVTHRAENARGVVSYITKCTQCGQSGQRITQAQFEDSRYEIKCCNPGCGKVSAPREYRASVEIRQREDVVMSPRQRAEAAASKAAREAFEKEQQ